MVMAPEALQAARLMEQDVRRVTAPAVFWQEVNSLAHLSIGEEVAARAEAAKRRTVVENCILVVVVVVFVLSGV